MNVTNTRTILIPGDKYAPIVDENDEVIGVRCEDCWNWAPVGVPIKHKDTCGDGL